MYDCLFKIVSELWFQLTVRTKHFARYLCLVIAQVGNTEAQYDVCFICYRVKPEDSIGYTDIGFCAILKY